VFENGEQILENKLPNPNPNKLPHYFCEKDLCPKNIDGSAGPSIGPVSYTFFVGPLKVDALSATALLKH